MNQAPMNPFSRPAAGPNHNGPMNGNRPPFGGHNGRAGTVQHMQVAGDISKWQDPSYPLVGFDPASFLTANKIAVSVGLAALVGGLVYYYGYR